MSYMDRKNILSEGIIDKLLMKILKSIVRIRKCKRLTLLFLEQVFVCFLLD